MKTKHRMWVVLGAVGGGSLLPVTGCGDLLRANIAMGIQDGTVTTATDILNGFFDARFNTGNNEEGGNGNDLFVRL